MYVDYSVPVRNRTPVGTYPYRLKENHESMWPKNGTLYISYTNTYTQQTGRTAPSTNRHQTDIANVCLSFPDRTVAVRLGASWVPCVIRAISLCNAAPQHTTITRTTLPIWLRAAADSAADADADASRIRAAVVCTEANTFAPQTHTHIHRRVTTETLDENTRKFHIKHTYIKDASTHFLSGRLEAHE